MQPITTMCRCGGMVDTRDLKSLACMGVPVRVRSAVPLISMNRIHLQQRLIGFSFYSDREHNMSSRQQLSCAD